MSQLKSAKRTVVLFLLILIVSLNALCVRPAMAAKYQSRLTEARHHRLRGKIHILYDPSEVVMSETARNIFTALELANVSSSLIEVSSTISWNMY